uniref:Cubilin-like n=1 Tax=Phallusia mammillata TaxID=59560 RepID=A0A6F9DAS6_9ASCI|nr:cubilin-like [Phallusia mammillata]
MLRVLLLLLCIIFVKCEYLNSVDSSHNVEVNSAANSTNISDANLNECEKQIKVKSKIGVIASPNYPLPYDDNTTCFWKLEAQPGYFIRLSFEDFNLEGGVTDIKTGKFVCAYDFVHIYERYRLKSGSNSKNHDGKSEKRRSVVLQKVWGSYCGLNPPRVRTTALAGSTLYVYFFSDASKSGRGFLATFEHITDADKENRQNDWEIELDENKKTFNFYLVVFLSMCIGILLVLGSVCKMMARAFEYNDEYGRRRNRCCGPATTDEDEDDFTSTSNSRRLPTPPPAYGDVVKTEEDWLRVINQIGSETAEASRRDLATEDVSVSYDLNENSSPETSTTNGHTSLENVVTSSSQAHMTRSENITTVSSSIALPQVIVVPTNRGPRIFRRIFRPSHVGVGNTRTTTHEQENTRS